MENDSISRQAAIEELKRNKSLFCKNRVEFQMLSKTDKSRVDEIDTCISVLLNLPSVQPEIVRCKDCKFYIPMNRETRIGICNLTMHQNFGDNWFCAGAERRTDD